jgi:hypothetical protein
MSTTVPQSSYTDTTPQQSPKKRKWLLPLIAGLVIFFLGAGIGAAGGDEPVPAAAAKPAPAVTVTETTAPLPVTKTVEVEKVVVPPGCLEYVDTSVNYILTLLDINEQLAMAVAGTLQGDPTVAMGIDTDKMSADIARNQDVISSGQECQTS